MRGSSSRIALAASSTAWRSCRTSIGEFGMASAKTRGRPARIASASAAVYEPRIRHATNSVAAAATNPTIASRSGVSASLPINSTRPAIAVPICAGPPFRNARL